MKRTILLGLITLLSCSDLFANAGTGKKPASKLYISNFENVLGTSMELKVTASSTRMAAQAEAAALAEIKRIAKLLSGYDAQSEFSRWFKTKNIPVKISPELFEVLSLYDTWRTRTHGALDAAAQAVSRLWKDAAAKNQLPSAADIDATIAEVKQQHWILDAAKQTATHLTGTPLILNSFTKSYIIKHATTAAMSAAEIDAIVLNIGGDIVVNGQLSETISISDPKADAENDAPIAQISVHDRAVATSGNYRRGEMINGQWYSHIVDPRTGQPAGEVISATVVAPDAADAGALATSFNVLTPSESVQLANSIPGVEYLLITKTGERIKSKGWTALEIPPAKNDHNTTEEEWNKGFELAINIEVATINSDRIAHRPYVAVWVEDDKHNLVRNISLWYHRPRWLQDLKEWNRLNKDNFTTTDVTKLASVSSATRSPGKYSLKWDGKDEAGNFTAPGNYTICIEAAREHGTYQIIRQNIECKRKPQSISLPGNIEIAAASIEYRKKDKN